jgi:hypothetical protein
LRYGEKDKSEVQLVVDKDIFVTYFKPYSAECIFCPVCNFKVF